jgi:hypothetical protein
MALGALSIKWGHDVQLSTRHLLPRRILPVWRIWIKARLRDISDGGVTTLSTIKVESFIVAVHVAYTILLLLHEGRVSQEPTVSTIMAGQYVVTLRITVLIPNLADVTVGQDEAVTQGGVAHLQHLQLPRDIIEFEGVSQLLVLEVDLLATHYWVLMVIIIEVDHAVAYHLRLAEIRQLVIAGNDLCIVTQCLPTQRRLQTRVQQEAMDIAEFHLGTIAILHGGPSLLHIVPVLLQEELR